MYVKNNSTRTNFKRKIDLISPKTYVRKRQFIQNTVTYSDTIFSCTGTTKLEKRVKRIRMANDFRF